MASFAALLRVARAVALAAAVGLLVSGGVVVGEAVHSSIDRQGDAMADVEAPFLKAEVAGWVVGATLAPALALTPLPERFRRTATVVRAGAATAAVTVLAGLADSMADRADPAAGALLIAPATFAGLVLASWPFPDPDAADAAVDRWRQLLLVPSVAYLAAGLAVQSALRPFAWTSRPTWALLVGPVALFATLWGVAWLVRGRSAGAARSAERS
jgi:hypothetical protein